MPRIKENNCDCDACRFNKEQEARQAAGWNELQKMFDQEFAKVQAEKQKKLEEVADLAKGKAVVVGLKLGQDIWADQHACGFVRLNEVERLLFSGQARKATRRELQALAT